MTTQAPARPVPEAPRSQARSATRWLGSLLVLLAGCRSDAQVIGHAGESAVWHVAADGARAYTVDETTLRIYDFSAPAAPREVGSLESPGKFGAVAAAGSIAYIEVAIPFKGLEREPESLDQQWIGRGWLKIDGRSYSQGEFIGVSHLLALDVSDPARAQVVGLLNLTPDDTLPAKVDRMTLSGSTLYVGRQYGGVLIVDVANPRALKDLGSVDRGHQVVAAGRRLFVADGPGIIVTSNEGREEFPGGFQVLEAADPGKIRETGRIDSLRLGEDGIGANVETVAAAGDHAYLGLSVLKGLRVYNYLVVVDASDPAQPREVWRTRLKKGVESLAVAGGTLYVEAEEMMYRYDLDDPANPKQLGDIRLGKITGNRDVLRTLVADSGIFVGTWDGLYLVRPTAAR